MDDLISRSALLEILEEEHESIRQIYCSLIDNVEKSFCKGELGTYARVKRIVEEAPAVDAVEVVRCKDCKWFTYLPGCIEYWCDRLHWWIEDDDFCSYGERREENAAD